ncbi:MAG: hypothetical protein NTU53_17915 [Planctomycetota bacterium]|nr:hypothetical protein [Planctomycetota bacterium]
MGEDDSCARDSSDFKGRGIHIDTTLQLERLKTTRRAAVVEATLCQYNFRSTSTYARHELNRAWLRDLAWLYATALTAKRLEDVYDAMLKSFGHQQASKNRLTRCLEIATAFLQTRPDSLTPDLEVLRLREHLVYALTQSHTAWRRSVHHEFDGTGCIRADEQPKRASNERIIFTLPQCRRNRINCKIHSFFEANRKCFEQIAQKAEAMGDAASGQLRRAAEVIRSALNDAAGLCDDRRCAELGDALIAIDGMEVGCFGANNDREWVPIAEALERELVNPVRVQGGTAA